jgi:cytochrome c553
MREVAGPAPAFGPSRKPATTLLLANEIADYHMMRPLTIAACLALTTAAFAASAQDNDAPATPAAATAQSDAAVVGDIERGRQLIYTCQGCHGVTGYVNAYPNYHVPKIGGQSAQYLINALTAYKNGTRPHPTMQAQAESFSEQDIADIAAFLSSLSK